jgi:hypothetical protein
MGAMIVHAAAYSAQGTVPGTFAVVLSAKDESALIRLEERLIWAKVPHSAFREPDAPYNNALMAIGINPVEDRRMVRRFIKGFPLLGSE